MQSLVDYYRSTTFNPVTIPVEQRAVWQDHYKKRRNLYQRHLGIPVSWLQGRRVVEFGCNSGENALVLAAAGARLTLVEPNEQVLPRLNELFDQFQLSGQIDCLSNTGIDEFESNDQFDLVVAEGFLFSLPNRDNHLRSLCNLLSPGGLLITSFLDRTGILAEMTKRLVLYRAYALAGISDDHSDEALQLAKRLFAEDFNRIKTSRDFFSWWKDTLVNPVVRSDTLWSHPELLPLFEDSDCEFYSASPRFFDVDQNRWYKDVEGPAVRHERLRAAYAASTDYLVTGVGPAQSTPASPQAATQACALVDAICRHVVDRTLDIETLRWPEALDRAFDSSPSLEVRQFNTETRALYASLATNDLQVLLDCYLSCATFRRSWGAPYHYAVAARTNDYWG